MSKTSISGEAAKHISWTVGANCALRAIQSRIPWMRPLEHPVLDSYCFPLGSSSSFNESYCCLRYPQETGNVWLSCASDLRLEIRQEVSYRGGSDKLRLNEDEVSDPHTYLAVTEPSARAPECYGRQTDRREIAGECPWRA